MWIDGSVDRSEAYDKFITEIELSVDELAEAKEMKLLEGNAAAEAMFS